jgi:hypothetical protein
MGMRMLDRGTTKIRELHGPLFKVFMSYLQMTFGVLLVTKLHEDFRVLLPVFRTTQTASDGGLSFLALPCYLSFLPWVAGPAAQARSAVIVASMVIPLMKLLSSLGRVIWKRRFLRRSYIDEDNSSDDDDDSDDSVNVSKLLSNIEAKKANGGVIGDRSDRSTQGVGKAVNARQSGVRQTIMKRTSEFAQKIEGVVIPVTGSDRFDMIALYLIHPVISKHLMTILPCAKFAAQRDAEGEVSIYEYDTYRHLTDINLVCYEGAHLWYSIFSIGGLILWGFGIPFSFYRKLHKVKDYLRNPTIRRRYGFIYDGFENDMYYYESLLMVRKLAFLGGVNALPVSQDARTVILMFTTFCFLCMHVTMTPFDNRGYQLLDKLEASSMLAVIVSLSTRLFYTATGSGALSFILFATVNLGTLGFFIYGFYRTFFHDVHNDAFVPGGKMVFVGNEGQGTFLEMSDLTDQDRNFICLVISEIVDLLNDTESMVSLEKLGLILRAAAACALQGRYLAIEHSLKTQMTLRDKGPIAKLRYTLEVAIRNFIQQLKSKTIQTGRGSFVEPAAIEGRVTVEELHNGWLTIAPFVASNMVNLKKYGVLTEPEKQLAGDIQQTLKQMKTNITRANTGIQAQGTQDAERERSHGL